MRAARAFLAGDPTRAARIYAAIGSRPDQADALLAAGRTADGRAGLEAALAFYREVGATAAVEQAKALLYALA